MNGSTPKKAKDISPQFKSFYEYLQYQSSETSFRDILTSNDIDKFKAIFDQEGVSPDHLNYISHFFQNGAINPVFLKEVLQTLTKNKIYHFALSQHGDVASFEKSPLKIPLSFAGLMMRDPKNMEVFAKELYPVRHKIDYSIFKNTDENSTKSILRINLRSSTSMRMPYLSLLTNDADKLYSTLLMIHSRGSFYSGHDTTNKLHQNRMIHLKTLVGNMNYKQQQNFIKHIFKLRGVNPPLEYVTTCLDAVFPGVDFFNKKNKYNDNNSAHAEFDQIDQTKLNRFMEQKEIKAYAQELSKKIPKQKNKVKVL